MHIVFVSQSRLPVDGYGGTERQTLWLAKALIALGHEVSIVAAPGSSLDFCRCIPYEPTSSREDFEKSLPSGWDLVHFQFDPPFAIDSWPAIITCHGNGKAGQVFPANTVFVSRNHAQRHHSEHFVYNGLDLEEYPFFEGPRKSQQLMFLAKASWSVKNLDGAIRLARLSQHTLWVAGGRRGATWRSWFARNAIFGGTIGGAEKIKRLQESKALLFPVIWHEPFGIAVIEAMACGTPVIASALGSLPELIDSSCGFLCRSESEFLDAIANVQRLSPQACRARVEQHFSSRHSALKYLEYYQRILDHGSLPGPPAHVGSHENPGKKVWDTFFTGQTTNH